MSTRDRTGEIVEVKERNPYGNRFGSFELESLKARWLKTRADVGTTPDFYVTRAVTLLEVFTRTNIAELVDHGTEYANRAIEFSKNLKLDFPLVQSIQGRVVTLGDVVAHSISVNSFGQMLGYFETLLDKRPLRPVLTAAVDRRATEVERKPAEPIIGDFETMATRLSALFEIRHILTHEIPKGQVYSIGDIEDFLTEASRFTNAMEEVLTFERFGLVPLTQTEMNIAAAEDRTKKETELKELLSEIRAVVKTDATFSPAPGRDDKSWVDCLDDAQEKWLSYRNAQCDFGTYPSRGGTIHPTLWASEATRLTEIRIADLRAWLKHESES